MFWLVRVLLLKKIKKEMCYLLENGVKDRESEPVKFVPTVRYTRDLSDLNKLVKSGAATPEEISEFNQRFAALKVKNQKKYDLEVKTW